jgi:hypothetical protein
MVMAIDSKHKLDDMSDQERVLTMKLYGTFYIVEVGYGGDTFYTDTYARKKAQHKDLRDYLTQRGWSVREPVPIILGHGGSIYKSTFEALTQTFQIPAAAVRKTLHKIQQESAKAAHHTVISRWLEVRKLSDPHPVRTHTRPKGRTGPQVTAPKRAG